MKENLGYFSMVTLAAQIAITAFFIGSDYDLEKYRLDSSAIYNFYVGVALMMFVGFGYLMTFLKAYGLGAVGLTMFITCLGCEWALLLEKVMVDGYPMMIGFDDFMNMLFAVAAVLISFGAVIGKTSPMQILLMTLVELVFYCVNKVFLLKPLEVVDCGGTIIIHVFGAYFGLACAKVFGGVEHELNSNSYVADLFSLIGTVFLWLFWPSFVAGGLPSGEGQTMALMNTVLALIASAVTAFAVTPIFNVNRLTTVPIQNATLAGGVAIGATANFAMGPVGAITVGMFAGAISTAGFCRPLILGSIDTCGINSLHGMPGIFGGVVSVLMPYIVQTHPSAAQDKEAFYLAINQGLGLLITLAVSLLTGAATGFLLKALPRAEEPFSDATFWDCGPEIPQAQVTEKYEGQARGRFNY